jgi:hypothetical protein
MKNPYDIDKLEAFFKAVAQLTLNHDVINDHACVTADKLGKELEKVDPEWYEEHSFSDWEKLKDYIGI